jgi:2,4-dienoyl-CoA reductase-like NADH-dependent reductase (Old Yellow Enzyme family)
MTKLFKPLKLRDLEVRNRIFIAPMCQYSCENQDGVVNSWHEVHYGSRSVGGAGMVIVEATGVSPEGRITPWCAGIWNEEQVVAWKRVNDIVKNHGARSAIQLAHAGRKASTQRGWDGKSGTISVADRGWSTVSATSEPFEGYEPPRELQTAEVYEIIEEFKSSAERSVRAGFEAIEIHAAHGYLIHQFLSPLTNNRTDEFGGSLENRARLLLEITKAIRAAIPSGMPLMIRFSATDYRDGGWDLEQTQQVAKWCAEAGVDLFDISSGGLITGVKIPTGPGYQVPLAIGVGEVIVQPVAAVGQITTSAQAEKILQGGGVEVIAIARASLRDPYWPLRAAAELGVEVDYWPTQYLRGKWPKD